MSEINQHTNLLEQEQAPDEQDLKFYRNSISWRRNLVLNMLSEGHNQAFIARTLKLHPSTISLDCQFLREQSRTRMHDFITERLPMAVTKSCAALDSITATAWNIAKNTEDDRVKLNALTLIKEAEKDKIDIVSNVNLVDQVIDAAEQKQRVAIPTPLPTPEEEQAIADEYIRDTKYSEKEEDPAPTTRAKAIPVSDNSGEDN